jgi:hypothetical protein
MMSEFKTEYEGSWIGVDFDGTLATYDGWKGPDVLGEPVPAMVERVKAWLEDGEDVRIMTARVSPIAPPGKEHFHIEARAAIIKWCKKHIGCELEITHEKDYLMRELWDDRAVQVEAGTGIPIQSRISQLEKECEGLRASLRYGVAAANAAIQDSDRLNKELALKPLRRFVSGNEPRQSAKEESAKND